MTRLAPILVALLALAAVAFGVWRIEREGVGLTVTTTRLGDTPVTVRAPTGGGRAPAVVIAHGFAGSQPLMAAFATTLARNGYVAVTFDFIGHGDNTAPLLGGLANRDLRTRALLAETAKVIAFARSHPDSDGRIALVGHSMASDIVVRQALADPMIAATVPISLFSRAVTAEGPRNLLVLVGALEDPKLIEEGARAVGLPRGELAAPGVTFGRIADGTARRLVVSPGADHVGVLYSGASLDETRAWLDATFGRTGGGFVDGRGVWMLVVLAGALALLWPATRLLPRLAEAPLGAGLSWRRVLLVALVPAVVTPLALWKAPTEVLPLLLGDYLALHFGVYGLLTVAGLALAGAARPTMALVARPAALVGSVLALTAACVIAIGLPIDRYLTTALPGPARWPLVGAVLLGTLAFFLADEWLVRGAGRRRGAAAVTKLLFLASLVFAIVLNLPKLFFLAIITPAMAVFFLVFGLVAGWSYGRTGHPLVGAVASAAMFALAIGTVFPLIAR